jgi:hypothetical protein
MDQHAYYRIDEPEAMGERRRSWDDLPAPRSRTDLANTVGNCNQTGCVVMSFLERNCGLLDRFDE